MDNSETLSYFSVICIHDSNIILTGGETNFRQIEKKCHVFNTIEDKWCEAPIPDLRVERKDHSSCCIGNNIYVVGGRGGENKKPLSSIEQLTVRVSEHG